jgi:hypothetical protein
MTVFVLDYDNTFSVNPEMWMQIVKIIKTNGYKIIGATARNRYEEIKDSRYFDACYMVVYCAGNSKQKVLQNMHIDDNIIWIDDDPQYIVHSYDEIHDKPYDPGEGVSITEDFYTPYIHLKGLVSTLTESQKVAALNFKGDHNIGDTSKYLCK